MLIVLLGFSQLFAQKSTGFWKNEPLSGGRSLPADELRPNKPTEFKTFSLDFAGMKTALREAPLESKSGIRSSACLVELPTPEGDLEIFRVVESPVMPAKLAQKYPEIHTFTVESTTRPGVWGKLDIGSLGLHAAIFEPGRTFLVEPVGTGVLDFYQTFDRKKLEGQRPPGTEILLQNGATMVSEYMPGEVATSRGNLMDPVSLRRFKFALSTTAEYSALAGGTPTKVMAAVVTAINRFNGILERDFAMRFDLVDNADTLFFYDAVTDPFNPGNVPLMAQFNADVTDARIGPDNYDLGHVFSIFAGGSVLGIAGGSVCTASKAKACSTDPNPLSDNFIITVCQEIEHQFTARHTWNRCGDPGGSISNQYHPESAFEPGSGSTIVSYAGGCGTDDVKSPADDYNHSWSIQQVRDDVTVGNAATCADVELTNNNQPTATENYSDGFYIPISTPFTLVGSGSDPEDTGLTYFWEQMNLGPQSPLGQPQGFAPLFRSVVPNANPRRIFPNMLAVFNAQIPKTEVLPTTDRPLNFRMTVLDNHPGGGGQHWVEVSFLATASAGPFKVLYPTDNGVVWKVGEFRKVEWDVANTKGGKVNCSKVNIKLSTANGQIYPYPITLATNEDNDGSAWIQVPNNVSSTCRVLIEAADNIFFDISNKNFAIEPATVAAFSTAPFPDNGNLCLPTTFSSTFKTSALAGFSGQITFAFTGLPAGATANFVNATVDAGSDAVLNIDCPTGIAEGAYPITVTATSGASVITNTITLTVVSNDFTQMALLTPPDGDASVGGLPNFTWKTVADADEYEWQLDETPAFNSANLQDKLSLTTGTTQPTTTLLEGKQYFWRVRAKNSCGLGDWIGPFSFGTLSQSCTTFENTTPMNILGSVSTIESKLTSTFNGTVSDVNLLQMTGSHEFFKDLETSLVSPSGTEVILFKGKCNSYNGNFKFGIDDQAAIFFLCPPSDDLAHKPDQTAGNALANFNNQNANGEWKLRVKDQQAGSGGVLASWKLQICGAGASNPPVLVNKGPSVVNVGGNVVIPTGKLLSTDPNNSASQLIYTIVKATTHGDLRRNGASLVPGSQFSQADIDNGLLQYFHAGGLFDDSFTFTVIDGEGGFIGTPKYDIIHEVVGTNEAQLVDFQLVPNPATDAVRLICEQSSTGYLVEIMSTTGQILRSENIAAGQTSRQVSLAGLPSGIYLVSMKSGDRTGVRRLVKN